MLLQCRELFSFFLFLCLFSTSLSACVSPLPCFESFWMKAGFTWLSHHRVQISVCMFHGIHASVSHTSIWSTLLMHKKTVGWITNKISSTFQHLLHLLLKKMQQCSSFNCWSWLVTKPWKRPKYIKWKRILTAVVMRMSNDLVCLSPRGDRTVLSSVWHHQRQWAQQQQGQSQELLGVQYSRAPTGGATAQQRLRPAPQSLVQ